MFLDPSQPIAFSVGVLTLAVAGFALIRNPQCAVALLLSLVTARLLTETTYEDLHVHVLGVCVLIAIADIRFTRWKQLFTIAGFSVSVPTWMKVVGALNIDTHEVNFVVAFVYLIRMIINMLDTVGLYSTEVMWLISIVFLLIQILLVAGSCFDGRSHRLNNTITRVRIGIHRSVALLLWPEKTPHR